MIFPLDIFSSAAKGKFMINLNRKLKITWDLEVENIGKMGILSLPFVYHIKFITKDMVMI